MKTYREWYNEQIELNEMAVERKKAEQVINSLADEIYKHIVKILYWIDEDNFDKHCTDINSWLFKCQDITLKPKNKRITADIYYEWLFGEFFDTETILKSVINRRLVKYNELPRTEINTHELFNKLKKIYSNVSKDLGNDKFNTIKDYI